MDVTYQCSEDTAHWVPPPCALQNIPHVGDMVVSGDYIFIVKWRHFYVRSSVVGPGDPWVRIDLSPRGMPEAE